MGFAECSLDEIAHASQPKEEFCGAAPPHQLCGWWPLPKPAIPAHPSSGVDHRRGPELHGPPPQRRRPQSTAGDPEQGSPPCHCAPPPFGSPSSTAAPLPCPPVSSGAVGRAAPPPLVAGQALLGDARGSPPPPMTAKPAAGPHRPGRPSSSAAVAPGVHLQDFVDHNG